MAREGFPILMYHRVEDSLYMEPGGLKLSGEHCSLKKFTAALQRLKREFKVVPLSKAAVVHRDHLLENTAVLTFDDGTRDHVEVVLPLLQEFGLTATFFVMSGPFSDWIPPTFKMQLITGGAVPLGEVAEKRFPVVLDEVAPDFARQYRKGVKVPQDRYISESQRVREMKYLVNYLMPARTKDTVVERLFHAMFGSAAETGTARKMFLSPADIRKLTGAGMTIGSHSRSHYNLATLGAEHEVFTEVVGAKEEIARNTGVVPAYFAYPAGGRQGFTPANAALVAEHFAAACITGTQRDLCTPADGIYELPRIHEKYFG